MTGNESNQRDPHELPPFEVFPLPSVPVEASGETVSLERSVRPKSEPESTWLPPPSSSRIRRQLAPPQGNRFLAGAAFGFMFAAVAVIALWFALPGLFSRDHQQAGPPLAQPAVAPTTKDLPSDEKLRELEKQLARLRQQSADLQRELDLAQATKEHSEQLLVQIARMLTEAKRLPNAQALSAATIAKLIKEHDESERILNDLAGQLKTSPDSALSTIRQLVATRDLLEMQRRELLVQLDAARSHVPASAPSAWAPPAPLPPAPKTGTGVAIAPSVQPEPPTAIPLLPGNSWLVTNPTSPPAVDIGLSQPTVTTLPALTPPSRFAPLGPSALGGQPIRPAQPPTRMPPRIGMSN